MLFKNHPYRRTWTFLLLAIAMLPLQLVAQKKVKGNDITRKNDPVLSKVFKKYGVFDINIADLAQHAKSNGKSTFEVDLELEGAQLFSMNLNETNLLSNDYHLIIGDAAGRKLLGMPNCKTYAGTLRNDDASSVFLTISDKTIYGFIKSNGRQFHIEPMRYFEKDAATTNFVLYEASDVNQNSNQACGVTELDERMAQISTNGMQTLGEATGLCKITDVGIASDKSMLDKYGSAAMVEEHNISVMNMVVGLYRNAQIGSSYIAFRIQAQYVSLSTPSDPLKPIYNGRDADSILVNFSTWATETGFATSPDLLQLWTARNFGKYVGPGPSDFNYGVIGLAYLSTVCKANGKFQILEAFTGLSGMSLGILAAHEIGHNFGALHDGDGNAENNTAFIMAPSLNVNATSFSNTSLQAMTTYTNTISCLSSCSGVIIPEFNASSTAICTGNNVTFTNATVSDVPHSLLSFVWRLPGGNPSTSTAISPTVSYATPGRKTVTLEVGSKTITKEIFVGNAPTQACRTLTPKNSDVSSLLSFSFGSIGYKASTVIVNGDYKDFACSMNTKLTPGKTYAISAEIGYQSVSPINSRLQIFLDYNNDGDFLDANEMLYTGAKCIAGMDTVLFTAPPVVSLLDTWLRLRVVAAPCNVSNSDGCALSGNANIFDFAVYFEKPPTCILYVNANATGKNDGSSWANAFTNLTAALNASCFYGTQIWVAKGTYKPTSGNSRDSAFVMKKNVAIYGGFAGTETQLTQRNWATNPTILSGDIGVPNNINDNSYHLIFNNANGLDSTAVLDGFIVKEGNAFKGDYFGNRGGGVHNFYSAPAFYNCIFSGNNAVEYGGAMFNQEAAVKVVNCVFAGNTALYGGGLYNESAPTEMINCTFSGNDVAVTGAAMYTYGAVSPKITNSIIWGNGSGIQNAGGATPIVNTSIVQGGYAGTGNLNQNPLFVQQPVPGLGNEGDLRLRPCSPAVNTGNNFAFPANITSDLAGVSRIINTTIDRGAYELSSTGGSVLYVNAGAPAGGNGTSWATALRSLQDALVVEYCSVYTQIWVAKGTYTPTSNTNRDSAFVMRNNLAIYGGFAGTETLLSQRNWRTNVTILSGDIGTLNNRNDNSFNVVRNDNNGLNNTAILDGFTVTGGNANKGNYVGNVGAGIFNRGGSAVYRNCILTGNQASVYGGGFFSENGAPLLINSAIAGNTAAFGAGLYNESATTNIINCTIAGNLASNGGGGWFSFGAPVATMRNCIVWGNSSGIGVNSSAPEVSNSLIQGGYAGIGNLNTDPFFTNTPTPGLGNVGDLRLLPCSPAINVGNDASMPGGYTLDLGGFTRVWGTIDMGAYERQILSIPFAIYVDANATGRNDGYDWPNAFTSLQSALNALNFCTNPGTAFLLLGEGVFTAPSNVPFVFNKAGAIIRGGYSKGGTSYTPWTNPAVIKGEVRVLQSLIFENVLVEKQ